MQPGPLNPARLAPGTRVGRWRIVDRWGRGAYGVVYLVEGVEPQASGPAALKLAQFPRDARFAREAEVLSRLCHPCVPRLLDQGHWQSGPGTLHPYFVMEWSEGLPLYVWAQACRPSSRRVLQVLAGLARALEATHSAQAAHRDVKGDNVLVQPRDGRPFLVDFGSATYEGATPLTTEVFPPGTPAYRSPEAFRFERDSAGAPGRSYAPGPADDLFALGVTAWRLVTGEYPASRDWREGESHVWSLEGPGARPAHELNPRCGPELSALVARMLALRPEDRGSARELAEALEHAAREAGPEADGPLFVRQAPRPAEEETVAQQVTAWAPRPVEERTVIQGVTSRAPRRSRRPWLVVPVALVSAWVLTLSTRVTVMEQGEEARDAGTSAVGDATLTAPVASAHRPAVVPPIALDMPSRPFPGQTRPDAKGRCPKDTQVAINGGCWLGLNVKPENCKDGYVYKGVCYEPALPFPRPPTSSPVESPDGG